MKRFFALLITLCLTCTGCSHIIGDGIPEKDGITIVTTNFFLYDAARTLARPEDEVIMLISPGTESHDYELTLADMAKIETCDLFAYVGGEGEGWVYDALHAFGENGIEIPAFCAMEAVEKAGTLHHAAGEHDHDHGEHHENHWEGIDDHVWLSVPNAIVIHEAMLDALKGYYENWTPDESVKYNLTVLDEKLRTLVSSTENPEILVADRFPFAYLTEEYGIAYTAAFEGCSSDTEASLETVNMLIGKAESLRQGTILVTELSDCQTAKAVAAQTAGLEIAELHSCHNVTKEDFDAGVTYIDLMERNCAVLEKLWK
ncbi:MAG: zinc ABC transporter substrate-binding protein [Clostridia bacterium]|nr:zinc ABC transporter substrate-binding protein [Clostridia bacterium]